MLRSHHFRIKSRNPYTHNLLPNTQQLFKRHKNRTRHISQLWHTIINIQKNSKPKFE
jgi:hypothetical protein